MTRTKQRCPITTCDTHELLLSARVESEVWRDVINLAMERGPCVITLVVCAQHRRGYACQGRHSALWRRATAAQQPQESATNADQTGKKKHKNSKVNANGGRDIHTRRSAPELFSAAQSIGLCPGARTTFARSLDLDNCTGGFVVVGGGIREEDGADGGGGPPSLRGDGSGGGGIRVEDDVSRNEDAEGVEEMRWALPMAGKAGGESSSGVWMDKEGFVGVVDDSSSSVTAGLLWCAERVGNHERR